MLIYRHPFFMALLYDLKKEESLFLQKRIHVHKAIIYQLP